MAKNRDTIDDLIDAHVWMARNFRGSENDSMRKSLTIVLILAVSAPMTAAAQSLGPLTTISPQDFLKLTENMQVLYVAGVLDGVSYTSYGYKLPDHDSYVRCARTMTVGVLAQRVADWIRANPKFSEGAATAVGKTLGAHCAH